MEEINEDWITLVQYLELYAKFQFIQTGSILALLIGAGGMMAFETEACMCLALLGCCGMCAMAVPSFVVMVGAPYSVAQLVARLLVYMRQTLPRSDARVAWFEQILLLTQWITVGDACDGNYYYEKIDWVVTLGIVIFFVNCASSCVRGNVPYEKATSSDNP